MKRILLFLSALFIATTAIAHTINWYVDGNIFHTTTCESGENVTPPTAPEKYGYTFQWWKSYTPIEYLESTGTQWIDTGIKQSDYAQNIIVSMTVQFMSGNGVAAPALGCADTTNKMYFTPFQYNDDKTVLSNIGKAATELSIVVDSMQNKHTVISNSANSSLQIDDSVYTYNDNTAVLDYNIYLFTRNNAGTVGNLSKLRFYNVSFYTKEGNLIRDFIPVLDKDGTPCMYDLVERKFYYNAGTGDFIAGPIIGK